MRRSRRLSVEDWNYIAPGLGDLVVQDVRLLMIVRSMLGLDHKEPEKFETLLEEAIAIDREIYTVEIDSSRFLEDLFGAIAFLNGSEGEPYIERFRNDPSFPIE
jgi:ABC-type uncharacterized transport system ATPase subunit